MLSWRLGPILALVIVATAGVVSTYRKQTKAVEAAAGNALARMVAIADQAFRGITTVRCGQTCNASLSASVKVVHDVMLQCLGFAAKIGAMH